MMPFRGDRTRNWIDSDRLWSRVSVIKRRKRRRLVVLSVENDFATMGRHTLRGYGSGDLHGLVDILFLKFVITHD